MYPIIDYASDLLRRQPQAPRSVSLRTVARAVLTGVDCGIYAVFGVLSAAFGALLAIQPGVLVVGLIFLVPGLLLLSVVIWRIWRVYQDLKMGSLITGTVTRAEVGPARWYGTLWGDMMNGTAASGVYRADETGEIGEYYLQQWWATELQQGARLSFIEHHGRPALFVPANQTAGRRSAIA